MIYLDSCIVIYAVESGLEVGARARRLLDRAPRELVISPMVIHESLVGPLRSSQPEAIDRMQAFLGRFTVVDLEVSAFIRAAELRARTPGLRAPDALHLAAAQLADCAALWTNDKRLAAASGGLAIDVMNDATGGATR